ncbi:beta-lactamase family protein [Olivibacter sp. SA151]|uniref:serine hydrolase domain-containing protein n=1 Tax=Olivibacter jilunii TaxID=985016 RepID=UPI003F1479BE
MKGRNIITFLICFLQIFNTFGQNYLDSLDKKLAEAFEKTNIPGFTACILNKNGIIYQKSFGFANKEDRTPFTENTIQNIGSVSKTFIAVALMKAVELGYFKLDDDINDILPFRVRNPYYRDESITVRQLTNHTSGIIDNDSIYTCSYLFQKTENRKVQEFMKAYGYVGGLTDTTLQSFLFNYLTEKGRLYTQKNFYNSKPGARSRYSNIGSALAAYLIEIKAGMSFAEFCKQHIFDVLRMSDSSWLLSDIDIRRHAIPYLNDTLTFPFYSLTTYPDGGLRASASDLTKYLQEMIHAINGNAKLLTQASINEMFRPSFSPDHLPENFSLTTRNKGIFWNLYQDGFIGHDGDDPGVSCNILFNKSVGMIFMANIYMEDRSIFLDILKDYAVKIEQEE